MGTIIASMAITIIVVGIATIIATNASNKKKNR